MMGFKLNPPNGVNKTGDTMTGPLLLPDGGATLGAELVTNGSMAADLASWTAGAGWAFASGAQHTAGGGTAALSQNIAVTSGTSYVVAFTITNRTTGSVGVTLGAVVLNTAGTTAFTATQAGVGIAAAATGNITLAFTPTNDFNGTLSAVSVKPVIAATYYVSNGAYALTGDSTLQSAGYGAGSLRLNRGVNNSALGVSALYSNTTGTNNSAQGKDALYSNTTGTNNSAQGMGALRSNTTGIYNSAQGMDALYSNTTGSNNSAQGMEALRSNTTGYSNSAQGVYALYSNTTGTSNSAQGAYALYSNTTGSSNSAQGMYALRFIADGTTPNATSQQMVGIGANTKASANGVANEIVIGYNAIGKGSNTATIGNASVTVLYLAGAVGWFQGDGSPEGVVTAPVGSMYSRKDGGVGTALYVKESGVGNTGWAAK